LLSRALSLSLALSSHLLRSSRVANRFTRCVLTLTHSSMGVLSFQKEETSRTSIWCDQPT
jgi:hypothetical protein